MVRDKVPDYFDAVVDELIAEYGDGNVYKGVLLFCSMMSP